LSADLDVDRALEAIPRLARQVAAALS